MNHGIHGAHGKKSLEGVESDTKKFCVFGVFSG